MKQKLFPLPSTLFARVLVGRYKVQGALDEADCVVALSFGMRCDKTGEICEHDPSNAALARFTEKVSAERKLPEYLQHEITEHLPPTKTGHVKLNVTRSRRRKQHYLDTYEVLRQVNVELKKAGYKRPVVVAHAYHAPRVVAILENMGFEPIVPKGLPRVWDAKSTQVWTRNYFFWIFRELPALFLYKLKGYY